VLVALLASKRPLLIIAEDAHWFDDATVRIIERIAASAAEQAWLVIAAGRESTSGVRLPDPDVVIRLEQLDDGVANELVELATQARPLRPQDRESIVARGNGNPLFLEELLRAAIDTDVDALPDTLDAVAMREIDALPPRARRVLRHASVLGPSFDRALLEDLLAAEDLELDVITLDDLEHHLVPSGREGLAFRHALFREAAYASLPFRTRLALHQNAGETIERRAAEVDEVAALLSTHFVESQDWSRAWRYSLRAAQLAQAAHAPGEAAIHLERAITAARRNDTVPPDDIGRLLSELGIERITLGLYDEADDAYRRSWAALRDEPVTRARIAERRSCIRGSTKVASRPASAKLAPDSRCSTPCRPAPSTPIAPARSCWPARPTCGSVKGGCVKRRDCRALRWRWRNGRESGARSRLP
jgi:predicted ATPase